MHKLIRKGHQCYAFVTVPEGTPLDKAISPELIEALTQEAKAGNVVMILLSDQDYDELLAQNIDPLTFDDGTDIEALINDSNKLIPYEMGLSKDVLRIPEDRILTSNSRNPHIGPNGLPRKRGRKR